jgi:uncharacterized protein
VPGVGETLRINGRARVVRDREVLGGLPVSGKVMPLGVGVRAEEAYLHCAKALRRPSLWSPDGWPDPSGLPSAARILRDHIDLPEITEDGVRRFLDDDYAHHLY